MCTSTVSLLSLATLYATETPPNGLDASNAPLNSATGWVLPAASTDDDESTAAPTFVFDFGRQQQVRAESVLMRGRGDDDDWLRHVMFLYGDALHVTHDDIDAALADGSLQVLTSHHSDNGYAVFVADSTISLFLTVLNKSLSFHQLSSSSVLMMYTYIHVHEVFVCCFVDLF